MFCPSHLDLQSSRADFCAWLEVGIKTLPFLFPSSLPPSFSPSLLSLLHPSFPAFSPSSPKDIQLLALFIKKTSFPFDFAVVLSCKLSDHLCMKLYLGFLFCTLIYLSSLYQYLTVLMSKHHNI